MNAEPTRRARGRPRDPAKRSALLDAARALFLEFGADAFTIDQVIAGAKVSRATFYSSFIDRHDLLAAVFRRESERIITDEQADACGGVDVRAALTSYGNGLMRFIADPDTMHFEPLILRVRQTHPEMAASLFAAGPRRVWDILERIIIAAQARDELDDVDPAQAVNDLVGLWQGSWRVEVMYGQRSAPDNLELQKRSQHAVDLFLQVHGRRK